MILELKYQMESAHRLLGYAGKCARLHGHNYVVRVVLAAEAADPWGFVMDSADADLRVLPVLARMDHRTLLSRADPLVKVISDFHPDHVFVMPENPTAEGIARFIGEELKLLSWRPARLVKVRVEETEGISAEWTSS